MNKKAYNSELIIRNNLGIKSRQWWSNKTNKIRDLLKVYCPKSKHKLIEEGSACILLTNNTEIKKLNKQYRKKDKATDVLSFQLERKDQIKSKYLGDIAISTQMAKRQAKERKVKIEDELCLLLVHAHLHLLGYDHETLKYEKRMFKLQNKILIDLKCKPFYLNE